MHNIVNNSCVFTGIVFCTVIPSTLWLCSFSLGCTRGRCRTARLKNIKRLLCCACREIELRSGDDLEVRRLRRCGCEVPPGLCFRWFLQPPFCLYCSPWKDLCRGTCATHTCTPSYRKFTLSFTVLRWHPLARYWRLCPATHHLMTTGL